MFWMNIWERILKWIFKLMKYEISNSRVKAKSMFCFLKINSRRNKMIDEFGTFNFYSIDATSERRWFFIFQPYRDVDKSKEVINIDETPSNHQGKKEEEWQKTIDVREESPYLKTCHRNWMIHVINVIGLCKS